KVHPGMTLSAELLQHSDDPADDLVRDLKIEGAHEIHLNLAHASPHYYNRTPLNSTFASGMDNQLLRFLEARKGRFSPLDILERLYLKGARRYVADGKGPVGCKAGSASVFIDTQWQVYPCTIHDHPLGRLSDFDFDLSGLSTTESFRRAVNKAVTGSCPGCWSPCEAYTALAGNFLNPAFYRLLSSSIHKHDNVFMNR
ncbi:MAG: hypothetical protein KJ645_04015, partial [Planctomycetes bacterium]|nr:hypothetical protein [Planctomycetota bacterium]